MNHVLKYIHGIEPLDDDLPSINTYWADRTTHTVAKVMRFEEATDEPFSQSVVRLEFVGSGMEFRQTVKQLKADFIRVSTPPSEKPFSWFRKFFDKRQILSLRDVEKTPSDQLQHLYVMNGLSVASFVKHQAHTKIPFPIPKLIIPMREQPDSGKPSRMISVWESWAPVDLLEQYKPSRILDSEEFMRAVAQGHLYILSTKYARHLMAQSETRAEIQRMIHVEEFVKREGAPRSLVNDAPPTALPPHYKDLE